MKMFALLPKSLQEIFKGVTHLACNLPVSCSRDANIISTYSKCIPLENRGFHEFEVIAPLRFCTSRQILRQLPRSGWRGRRDSTRQPRQRDG